MSEGLEGMGGEPMAFGLSLRLTGDWGEEDGDKAQEDVAARHTGNDGLSLCR